MQYRTLGPTGLKVSLVGLGTNNFSSRIDLEASRQVVHKALDLGINFIDTADVYGAEFGGSESYLGEILGPRRQEAILATKFGMVDLAGSPGTSSRRHIMTAVENSLRRLKTDWIDLYQWHKPDGVTPVEEVLRALDDLVRQGKVRYLGSSNLSGWRAVEAHWTARQLNLNSFACAQNGYSLLDRGIERELTPALEAYGLGLLPFFPLASGLLSGKYQRSQAPPADSRFAAWKGLRDRYLTEANWDVVEQLEVFCATREHTLLELGFSWLAAQKSVSSIIAGATRPEQVEQNVRAADWLLSADDLKQIDRLAPLA